MLGVRCLLSLRTRYLSQWWMACGDNQEWSTMFDLWEIYITIHALFLRATTLLLRSLSSAVRSSTKIIFGSYSGKGKGGSSLSGSCHGISGGTCFEHVECSPFQQHRSMLKRPHMAQCEGTKFLHSSLQPIISCSRGLSFPFAYNYVFPLHWQAK
jgi:hypothetical protein